MSNLPSSASEAQMIDLFQNFKMPIMGAGGGFAPIGTINFFDASIAPQGWLACDGSVVNIADYPDLATYYASVHGSTNFYGGDGTTTFAVPDLRGEFLRGTGTNGHANQGDGANVGVHQDGTVIPNVTTSDMIYASKTYVSNADSISTPSGWGYVGKTDYSALQEDIYKNYTSRPTNTSFLICVKATLSDTELNNMHVYSPNEHQYGWWQEEVDGVLKQKKVYEKVIATTMPSSGSTTEVSISSLNIDLLIDVNGTGSADALPFLGYIDNTNGRVSAWGNSTTLFVRNYSHGTSGGKCYLAIRYTKTTDQWQTV